VIDEQEEIDFSVVQDRIKENIEYSKQTFAEPDYHPVTTNSPV
jgi:hypothetical protein